MNSNEIIDQRGESDVRLNNLYRTIPFWRELLPAIHAGQTEFVDELAASGLSERFGLTASAVHDYRDIEVHAFILGIVSAPRWEEVQTKSYLTYASHWIDDFFDAPTQPDNFAQLSADRRDIKKALANMGSVGTVGFLMARRARHPKAVYKALHRMLYGGLVQRCAEKSERRALVEEYATVATPFLDPDLTTEISKLRPEAYWATNKTVLELLCAAEERVDFNRAELWSLIYAPALYYEDVDAERAGGELSFESDEAPTLDNMLEMVRLAACHLAGRYEPTSLELQQLRFAALALPNLPGILVNEYRMIWEGRSSRTSTQMGPFVDPPASLLE